MKYYIIAGEASGDLHASRLMTELKRMDTAADFRFFGGDMMKAAGGTLVKHYRDMAYMGFVPVIMHLRSISDNMSLCKKDIVSWSPDVVILVDYPGFNLSIARFVKSVTRIPVYYYISPKIWAWKEYRIKQIKRDVDEMFSILPFEKDFYEGKHGYNIHYVGNPTADEVSDFNASCNETYDMFCKAHRLDTDKSIIALLAGSRKQEIKDNLPAMIKAAGRFSDTCQAVVAAAPGIERGYYDRFANNTPVCVIRNSTYALLRQARAAVVTSGTATLETALFGVPQVVCYETPLPALFSFLRKHLLKVSHVSLVNLIAGGNVVSELVADKFKIENISAELERLLYDDTYRKRMIAGYDDVKRRLGTERAPDNAARIINGLLAAADC